MIRERYDEKFETKKKISEYYNTYGLSETSKHFGISTARVAQICQSYKSILESDDPEFMKFLHNHTTLKYRLHNLGYDKESIIKTVRENACRLLDYRDIGIKKIVFLVDCVIEEGIDLDKDYIMGIVGGFKKDIKRDTKSINTNFNEIKNDPTFIRNYKTEVSIIRVLEINPHSYQYIDSIFLSKKVIDAILTQKEILYDILLRR